MKKKNGEAANGEPHGEAGTAPDPTTFPIVAIGTSAGGLEALDSFFSHLPTPCGMAFVVIQHLDPDHKGILPELLQRTTALPVNEAGDGCRVLPDCVYVIPPNTDLSILRDHLYLLTPSAPRGLRLPIDFFFRSLADDRREMAIGIVLSGMGADGTLGLEAIRAKGGLTLVQTPSTARFDAMPRSAIDAGLAHVVAPPEELPALLLSHHHAGSPAAFLVPKAEPETALQKSCLEKICILLRTRSGHDFSQYKKSTLYRRIERRMTIHQLDRITDYVRLLRENPQELDLLFKELLIGVTSFFRDRIVWEHLRDELLPELLVGKPPGTVLRAWVAACSTGEEAYSLAMAFREAIEARSPPSGCTLQIFATDLDADAIARARQGFFPAAIASQIGAHQLARFFVEDAGGYRVTKEIREMVVFAPQNVLIDPPFTKLDILTCRNLLIYLGPELQKKLLPLFHYSLRPGGILLLGSAESIGGFTDLFSPVDSKSRLFRRSGGPVRLPELDFPTRSFPVQMPLPMDAKAEPPITNLQTLADQLLLQQFSPAAVLITQAGDLLYISGRTGKFLEPATGKANWNIHAMARDGLRQELALALPRAQRSGERVVCRNVRIQTDDGIRQIDLTVHPIREPSALRDMVMLVFTEPLVPPIATTGKDGSHASVGQREAELEQALTIARLEMQALHEEMQTSHEELKSTNEELQSTNEELQSANEELTTSKEEMQSLNEELQTVNVELQSKVDELSAANNDMKNLLNSTDIATVFLNNALHVRRFTTQATRLFKLIPGDVGRALSDIVTDLIYPELLDDAREVLRTLAFSDREITTTDDRWYQVKIMPYRTLENVIDGVVITFNDIGRAKRLEAELRKLGIHQDTLP